MTEHDEFDAHHHLRRTRNSHGWEVPTSPKPSLRVTLWHAAIMTLAIVVASVVGQWFMSLNGALTAYMGSIAQRDTIARQQAMASQSLANHVAGIYELKVGQPTHAKCTGCGSHEFRTPAGRTVCAYCRISP